MPRTRSAVGIAMTGIAAAVAVAVPSLASASAHHAVHRTAAATRPAAAKTHTLTFDEVDCTFGSTKASCLVAVAIKGGLLYGHFTETPHDTISGTITGGAGRFKGATGTIAGKAKHSTVVRYRY